MKIVSSGGSPIPAAYTLGDSQSAALVITRSCKQIMFQNTSTTIVAWGIGTAAAVPSTTEGYVANGSIVARDNYSVSSDTIVYISGDGSPITLGSVTVECW